MKEFPLYGPIYDYSAERFINWLEQYKNNGITLRVNSVGGSPEATWGMVAKFAEHTGRKLVKVDGRALSMGLYLLCYADDVEALDVSQFLIHRAAYPEWIESSKDYMTEAMWDSLKKVNDFLRKALEAKIDVARFEQLKGVTLDQVFSTETRVDVNLSAAEAKEIGLVTRVVAITPQKKAELAGMVTQLAAQGTLVDFPFDIAAQTIIEPQKNKSMTLAELLQQHPALHAEAVALGATQERDRVGSWLKFVNIDAEAAVKGIADGGVISQTQMADFALKSFSAKQLETAAKENAPEVVTGEPAPAATAEAKTLAQFDAEVFALLGKKPATA